MSIDFRQLEPGASGMPFAPRASVAHGRVPDAAEPVAAAARPQGDTVEVRLPSAPPPFVLDAVAAAATRARELAAAARELHFRTDEGSRRIVIQVRDLEGNVIRTIPPSQALDVMAGLYELEHA
jgi:hypothetical protein